MPNGRPPLSSLHKQVRPGQAHLRCRPEIPSRSPFDGSPPALRRKVGSVGFVRDGSTRANCRIAVVDGDGECRRRQMLSILSLSAVGFKIRASSPAVESVAFRSVTWEATPLCAYGVVYTDFRPCGARLGLFGSLRRASKSRTTCALQQRGKERAAGSQRPAFFSTLIQNSCLHPPRFLLFCIILFLSRMGLLNIRTSLAIDLVEFNFSAFLFTREPELTSYEP